MKAGGLFELVFDDFVIVRFGFVPLNDGSLMTARVALDTRHLGCFRDVCNGMESNGMPQVFLHYKKVHNVS